MSPGPSWCGLVTGRAAHCNVTQTHTWGHTGFGLVPPAPDGSSCPTLSPLAPFRPHCWGSGLQLSDQSCSPTPLLLCFWKCLQNSRHHLLHQLPTTSPGAVAVGAAPFQGLFLEINPHFRPNNPCFPPYPNHLLCHSPPNHSWAGNVSARSGAGLEG